MTTPGETSSLALQRITLLAGLPDSRLALLARQCRWRSLPARQVIVTRQAADGDVLFLVAGAVRVTTYSPGGRQVSFRDAQEGDYLGELAAIDGWPRSADVVTLAPSVTASLDRASFLALMQAEPLVAQRVMQRLALLVRQLSDRVIELSTLDVQHRLQGELLRLARESSADGTMARLDPAPRHADLASRISTNREQVTRELNTLAHAGLLIKDGKALVVPDIGALARSVAQEAGSPAPR